MRRLLFMQDELGADILKIAVMPQSRADVLSLLAATEEASRRGASAGRDHEHGAARRGEPRVRTELRQRRHLRLGEKRQRSGADGRILSRLCAARAR